MSKNKVKSHIQINKAILKNFSHKFREIINNKPCQYDKVFYLDLIDNQIKEENIKTLGTSMGYYSSEMETYLSKIEGDFGDEMQKAKNFIKNKTKKLEIKFNATRTFAAYLVLRSKYILNEVNKPSMPKQILELLGVNPIISHEKILKHPEVVINYLSDNYIVNIFENTSDIELVVSKNCIYEMCFTQTKKTYLFLPFTPRLAYVFIDKDDEPNSNESVVNLQACHTCDDELIKNFNLQALEYEIKYSNSFVVANRKKELEELQDYIIKSNKK